jgi:hypothetical protein
VAQRRNLQNIFALVGLRTFLAAGILVNPPQPHLPHFEHLPEFSIEGYFAP